MIDEHIQSPDTGELAVITPDPVYTFIYEQGSNDTWEPMFHHVQASTPGVAFQVFGRILDEMHMTVRNVCYGLYDEMVSQERMIAAHWSNYQHNTSKKQDNA